MKPFPARLDVPGIALRVRELDLRPAKLLRFSWAPILVAGVMSIVMVFTGAAAVPTVREIIPVLPDARALPESTHVYDVKGRQIATLYGEENRIVIPRGWMPQSIRDAVIAIEDDRFYDHSGLEPSAVIRALLANVAKGDVEQGGSTITQQYVRNAFDVIGRDKTMARKVREALLAMRYEQEHQKDDILERYLNTIYFGRGAYGIEAAARTYFNKPARELALHESAFLAGVIHAPEEYVANPKASMTRRNVVLNRMAEVGFISPEKAAAAKKFPLGWRQQKDRRVRAAYFVEYVRRLLKTPVVDGGFGLSDQDILTGGLKVYTTLDLDMQNAAERAVASVLNRKNDPEAALVGMTTDGQIRALVGGRNFTSLERARGFNFATQTTRNGGRSPGSTFKPFTLVAYLRQGYSARRVFRAPSRVAMPQCANPGRVWTPSNYGNEGFGSIDVVEATAKSVNTVYAQMIALAGPAAAVQAARDAGIEAPLAPVCSLALGTFGVTPLEMTRAYATFGARGARPDVLAVTKIVDGKGKVIAERKPRAVQTIERPVADQVNQILKHTVERGTGRPAAISRPSAGKTGTTEQRRDVWYAGYTPAPGMAAAVWVGYPPDRNGTIRTMRTLHGRPATGGYFGGRIWRAFMSEALKAEQVRTFAPADLGRVEYNRMRVRSLDSRRFTERRRTRTVQREEQRDEPAPKPQPKPQEKPKKDDSPPPAASSPPPEPEPDESPQPSPSPSG